MKALGFEATNAEVMKMIADVDKVRNTNIKQFGLGWVWDNRFLRIFRHDEKENAFGKECRGRNRKGF